MNGRGFQKLMSVELDRQERLTLGVSQQLFVLPGTPPADYPYGVLPGDESFLVNRLEESQRPDHLVLVQNRMSRLPR